MKQFTYELHSFTWRELEIKIRYCPGSFAHYAHVEIASACHSPLPISETGFRSHFTLPEVIDEFGGPVAFAAALLEEYAQSASWKDGELARGQLSLF